MKFVSLFAGIGGFDLGLERAGHTCVGQVEIADYPFAVLQKHWPEVPKIRDIRDFHGTEFGEFDLLTGGYPCQPFSYAGRREGENDPRHLWPEVNRIISNVRPKYVLLENVPGHLSLGFGRVLGDLAESGYDARWDCIPAAAVSAPHLRDRVFILAERASPMAEADGFRRLYGQDEKQSAEGRLNAQRDISASSTAMGDTKSRARGQKESQSVPKTKWGTEFGEPNSKPGPVDDWWETEPDVGRVAHGIPARAHRLKGLGNAVVPQVAQWIGLNWLPLEDYGPD